MPQEITNEFRMRVFALYPNVEVKLKPYDYPLKIHSLDFENLSLATADKYGETESNLIDDYQLILKAISEISDEDALVIARIILPLPFQKYKTGWIVARDYTITGYPYITIHNSKNRFKVQIDLKEVLFDLYDMEDCITRQVPMNNVHCIDQLRKWNYNLPYMGVDLIEAGIAIYQTK